ncbi:Oidioi.mRNA.OKI2018_I69.PAR.g10404.t1.cds [Oikopleura dioica]|uniref:Oidioi.mRNA.OKI2018_I69.PAR.g10404.t1.cds n=1 Tax=Oikopleura dioica TaxID=34765 RepID=A0ABN7RUG8_OIKDI|nr:Oidioi.mRNA.OKI2018_I69.PAR.g10404.t1.cds [Oikopleura dioica]
MEGDQNSDLPSGEEIVSSHELAAIIDEVDALVSESDNEAPESADVPYSEAKEPGNDPAHDSSEVAVVEKARDDETKLIPDTESIPPPQTESEEIKRIPEEKLSDPIVADSEKVTVNHDEAEDVVDHPLSPTPLRPDSQAKKEPEKNAAISDQSKSSSPEPSLAEPVKSTESKPPLADPLSMDNEDLQHAGIMAELSQLKSELANAHANIFRLKTQVENLNELKPIAEHVEKDDAERAQAATVKSNELVRKIQNLEKERNDSVMKYAMVEKRVLDSSRAAENATKEAAKAKANEDKMKIEAEKCRKTAAQATKDCNAMKEQFVANSNVLKWTQEKLKKETQSLEEEKAKNSKLMRDIKESKEETEQIRNNTQQIIATYQNSEEVRSNSLDGELKSLKFKYEELLEDNKQKTEKLSEITETLARNAQRAKEDLTELGAKYAQEQQLLKEVTAERDNLLEEVNGAKECAADRQQQAETLKTREAELLASVRSLTENNGTFRQELEEKSKRLETLEKSNAEYEELKGIHEKVTTSLKELRAQYETEKVGSVDELAAAKKAAEDANSRVKALEKQNQAIKKELRQALKKNESSDGELTRSSSRLSLDSMGEQQGRPVVEPQSPAMSRTQSRTQSPRPRLDTATNGFDDYGLSNIDKKELIHRLVENQKVNVKRNEKIDFLNDHVSQLTEELKKKTKLLQSFMLREQHGRMKPPGAEQELAQRVNRLLAGAHVVAPDNLDVVLEVNRKLQLVLEDTLLKNMMQQDNIKMLGEEIDRQHSSCRCKPNRMHR